MGERKRFLYNVLSMGKLFGKVKTSFHERSEDNLYRIEGMAPLGKGFAFGLEHLLAMFLSALVSWLLSKGMSYRTVARWVGDTESVVLETYSHLVPDEKDQIANFFDETYED